MPDDDKLKKIADRLDAVHARLDAEDDARHRRADFTHFGRRRADDDDDKHRARMDAEESALRERHEKGGAAKERADAWAKRGRKDAERCENDARSHFSARKDGETEADWRGRRDAEEESLVEKMEKEGEGREDAKFFAARARKMRDDDDLKAFTDPRGKVHPLRDSRGYRRAVGDPRHDDVKYFIHRRDSESDDDLKKRRDDEEKSLAKKMEEEGESREDAAKLAADARKRADDDDRASTRMDDKQHRMGFDSARHDALEAENKKLKDQIDEINKWKESLSKDVTPQERDALASAQSRADSVLVMLGDRAPEPNPGETSLQYRRRMAQKLQTHSARFKGEDISGLGPMALHAAEDVIYADAQTASREKAGQQQYVLVPDARPDNTGRLLTRFYGDPLAWMGHFMSGAQNGRITRNPGRAA